MLALGGVPVVFAIALALRGKARCSSGWHVARRFLSVMQRGPQVLVPKCIPTTQPKAISLQFVVSVGWPDREGFVGLAFDRCFCRSFAPIFEKGS